MTVVAAPAPAEGREWSPLTIEIGERISNLTVKDAKELADYLSDVHGIKAPETGYVPPAPETKAPVEEKTEFDVILEGFGDKKVGVIKVVRALTGQGLTEAKNTVESAPVKIKEGITKEEAEKVKKDLEEAGATVSIK